MSVSPSFVVQEAGTQHELQEARELMRANLAGAGGPGLDERVRLAYTDNPAGAGQLLLLREAEGHPAIGVQGIHPRRFHAGAKTVAAANLADYAVAPAHRTVGPALALMRATLAAARARFQLVYGLPNKKAAPVCLRAGMAKVGQMHRHVKVLASRDYLRRYVHAVVAALLALLIDPVLGLLDRLEQARAGGALSWRAVALGDPAVDEVWRQRPAELLVSERSAAMLHWRFAARPALGWQMHLALARGTPWGWVVARREGDVMSVGDFFCAPGAAEVSRLLSGFAGVARRDGAASISLQFFGAPPVLAGLQRAGFKPRGEPDVVVADREAGSALADGARWYLTGFDNDAD